MKVLKLDVDFKPPEDWLKLWIETRIKMLEYLKYKVKGYKIVETNRGFHAYFYLEHDVDDNTANMLQFLLGDDATRVKINVNRIKRGVKYWNKLFSRVRYIKHGTIVECPYCNGKFIVRRRGGRWILQIKP